MLQLVSFYKEMLQLLLFFLFAGLFIYGMALLRSGLFNLTGSSLKKQLVTLTDSPWKGFILGILMTAILQSGSSVMVLIIGLISARLLSFPQSIGIILGTNAGKNITYEMMTLDIHSLVIPLAVIGGILLLSKRNNIYHSGFILLGLAAIFGAMWGIEYFVVLLSDMEILRQLLLAMSENHFYSLLAGTVTTGMLQTSSAAIGIIMGSLSAGIMELDTGIAMMLGTIIGTSANVLFIGFTSGGREERLAAYAFTWANLLAIIAFYPLIELLAVFTQQLSTYPDVQLAHASAIIHILTSMIILLFINPFRSFILKLHGRKKNIAS